MIFNAQPNKIYNPNISCLSLAQCFSPCPSVLMHTQSYTHALHGKDDIYGRMNTEKIVVKIIINEWNVFLGISDAGEL